MKQILRKLCSHTEYICFCIRVIMSMNIVRLNILNIDFILRIFLVEHLIHLHILEIYTES